MAQMTASGAVSLIAQLWEQFRPLVGSRIDAIDDYVTAREAAPEDAARTRSQEAQLDRARQAAHNLSGALGSYGRPDGSTLATLIDTELADDAPDPETLRRLLTELRLVVDR